MSRKALHLSEAERRELEARVRAPATRRKERERCQAVLLSEAGVEQHDIAHALAWGMSGKPDQDRDMAACARWLAAA